MGVCLEGKCVQCKTDDDCDGVLSCLTDSHKCTGCMDDSDCGAGYTCDGSTCEFESGSTGRCRPSYLDNEEADVPFLLLAFLTGGLYFGLRRKKR
ncbi:MAG: hypothetical protein ABIJ56_00425 [Pseudomonadota bacterium]